VFRNLRGSNILIDSTGVVKLTDFEMCNRIKAIAQENLSEDNMIHDAILWAAPEVFEKSFAKVINCLGFSRK
jgi:serine/threonine protein kinase